MSAGLTDQNTRAEKEKLLERLRQLELRESELDSEESRLVRELGEVRKQIGYYEMLNRDMKREAVKEPHRPFLDMSRNLR